MTEDDAGLTPVKNAAKNRFELLRKTIMLSRGEPRMLQQDWYKTEVDDYGKCEMLMVSWITAQTGNQGFVVEYFTEKRVRIRAWGASPNYDVAVLTNKPTYHLLVDIALMAGLLNGDLS